MSRARRVIIGFAIVDVMVLAIFIVLAILKANKTAVLDISLTPSTAKISINGSDYMSGVFKVYPNEKVEATITADGFEPKTVEVELKANEIARIREYLIPDENNLNYYASNPDDATGLEMFEDSDAKKIVKILSIRDILPITDFQYGGLNGVSREVTINEFEDCNAYLCLQAIGNFDTEKQVDDLIVAKGYNPKDYEIKYEKR